MIELYHCTISRLNLYQMFQSFAGLDGRRRSRQPHSDPIQTLFLQIAEMVLKLG